MKKTGTVKIDNLRFRKFDATNPNHFRIDRFTKLGNPHVMTSEEDREKVIDAYVKTFHEILYGKTSNGARAELRRMLKQLKAGHDITLHCWCYPLRCHGDIIKAWLEHKVNPKRKSFSINKIKFPCA